MTVPTTEELEYRLGDIVVVKWGGREITTDITFIQEKDEVTYYRVGKNAENKLNNVWFVESEMRHENPVFQEFFRSELEETRPVRNSWHRR